MPGSRSIRESSGRPLLNGLLAFCASILLVFSGQSMANGFAVTVTVDETGYGSLSNTSGFFDILPSGMLPDPGPGGLPSVLTYGLLNPPGLTAGDVLLQDGVGGPILDVIRFNSAQDCFGSLGCLVFYSANTDGFDALADTVSPPLGYYANTVTLLETGTENGFEGAIYTPTPGQPGFVEGAAGPVTYILVSDIPEPATLALLGLGLAALSTRRRRQQAGNS